MRCIVPLPVTEFVYACVTTRAVGVSVGKYSEYLRNQGMLEQEALSAARCWKVTFFAKGNDLRREWFTCGAEKLCTAHLLCQSRRIPGLRKSRLYLFMFYKRRDEIPVRSQNCKGAKNVVDRTGA